MSVTVEAPAATAQAHLQEKRQTVKNPLNGLLEEAQRNIEKKDFEAALIPLRKFVAEQPDVAYGHFQLGYVFTALQKSEDARVEYERALALDPKMTEAYLNLGILLIDKDGQAATNYLRKAVEMLPEQSRPRYLLGVAQERTGNLAGAEESLEGAYRLDPHSVETTVRLANINMRLNRFSEAEAKYHDVLQAQPNNAAALLGVAEALEAEKKPAADAYRAYLVAQPGDAQARGRLVHILVEEQQYDAAIAELDRAGTGNPEGAELLLLRADIFVAQKKWDEAIASVRKAIALAPNDAALHGGLGRIYLQKRDYSSAQKELKIALQLDRTHLDYWKDLSTTQYLSGDYPSTLAALDEMAKIEPPGPGPWFIRALCYDKLNQPKPALDAYQKFLSLDQGKNADQVWQAEERSKVLRRLLEHSKR
ncbi:MAG: tetratricopeptide repeat protein [Acidobacteriota bacterium]|nr:tetratricopeptide repeat protein [Acidobacteriota bacterium]